MDNPHNRNRNSMFVIVLIALVLSSVFLAIMVNRFIGYGTLIDADAGTITEVVIDHRTITAYWFGLFGLAFFEPGFTEPQSVTVTGAGIDSENFVFDCLSPTETTNELYASMNSELDLSGSVLPGTVEMLDQLLNLSGAETDSTNGTFTQTISFLLGTTNISGVPAVFTYVNEMPNTTFWTGILNVSNDIVLVSVVYQTSSESFKGSPVRYQKMLPVPNSSTTWFVFRDPNDECPAASGTGLIGDGFVAGLAFDAQTNAVLENVEVHIGGASNFTDSNGFFNVTAQIGTYNLIGIKTGYFPNITFNIPVNISSMTFQNITLEPLGSIVENGTVFGVVRDSSTNATLANATVSLAGASTLSNASGNYSLTVVEGTHHIVAVKTGYDNFIGNVTINASINVSFNIFMDPLTTQAQAIENGTIQGYASEEGTNISLANVSVSVGGNTGITNDTGFYNFSALPGAQILVGVKSGYDPHIGNVVIESNNITVHNFTMNRTTVQAGVGNGTVRGFTFAQEAGILEGVTVSVAGQINVSNISGEYVLEAPAGTHNLVAFRTSYNNHFATINVTEGLTTFHNITLNLTIVEILTAGAGAGAGGGAGSGDGAGVPIRPITEIIRKKIDYEISIKRILKKIRVGSFIRVPINISNYQASGVNIAFAVEGTVEPMVQLSHEGMRIESDESGELVVTLLGNVDPDIYEGKLIISGDIEEEIPINVLVYEKELLPVEGLLVNLEPLKKRFVTGSDLEFRVDLQNLLTEERFLVGLTYEIQNINTNKSFFLHDEDVAIHTSLSLLKSLPLPEDLDPGDHILLLDTEYLGFQSTHKMLFTVSEPFYRYSVLGILPLWVLLSFIAFVSSSTFAIVMYRKRAERKRRYKGQVDFSKLPKYGAESIFVGKIAETDKKTYFDVNQFQVHTLIAGSTGSGKTVAAEGVVEALLDKEVAVIVFDPTAQWSGFLRKNTLKKMFALYPKFGMKKKEAHAFNGNVRQINDAREMIDIKRYIKPGEINIFSVSKLDPKDIDILVANTVRQVFRADLPESPELKLVIVFDEVHRLLPKFGGSGKGFLQIERGAREFRKWGVGLLLISQVLSDFVAEIKANINTEIQMRTRDDNDMKRIKEEYGDDILKSAVKAGVGSGLVENSAYNKGRPYFVTFKPLLHNHARLTDEELEQYNKYNDIIDDLDYQIEQLEQKDIDVFDLRLELKMALDKVKSGNFNMVGIYLEGLTPRVKGQWQKLGKKPKKREVKLVSEEELQAEVAKAEAARKEKGKDSENKKAAAETTEEKSEKEGGKGGEKKGKGNEKKAGPPQKKTDVKKKELVKKQTSAGKKTGSQGVSDIKQLVGEVRQYLRKGDQKKAKERYVKIQLAYKRLPAAVKKEVFKECAAIGKEMRG